MKQGTYLFLPLIIIFAVSCGKDQGSMSSPATNINTGPISGNIDDFAGNGASGYSGDGSQALNAALSGINGAAADKSGNIYIIDYQNYRIRKVANGGIISTVAGNGTQGYTGDGGQAINAEINVFAIAVDDTGNIYIADNQNNRVRKINTAGIISTYAGKGIGGFAGDGGLALSAELNQPVSLATDDSANLYIADNQNECIRKVNTHGIISTIAGIGNPGSGGFGGDGGPAKSAQLNSPDGVSLDTAGNIYITDNGNSRIRKVNKHDTITTIAGIGIQGFGGDGGLATSAEFGYMYAAVSDMSGNVFVPDIGNLRIREVTTSGAIYTISGNGASACTGNGAPAINAELTGPGPLGIDRYGNIYIPDGNQLRIIYK